MPWRLEVVSARIAGCDLCAAGGAVTSIWPTNNISERGVRPPKTQQKVSGRLASDDVTQDRLDIGSYIDTARKHGKNAMDALMLGTPWRPPGRAVSP